MTDINAKRDARRRRILENSESRLMRITGYGGPDNTESEGCTSKLPCFAEDPVENLNPSLNGIVQDDYDEPVEEDVFETEDTWNGFVNHPYRRVDSSDYSERRSLPRKSEEPLFDYQETYKDYTSETSRDYRPPTATSVTPDKTSFPWSLLTARTSYVLLALLVNLLLFWRLDYLFGKTIVVPWLTVFLTHLYGHGNPSESQEGSLLFAALILCNLKPELMYRLKTIACFFGTVLGDLALYIFSFTLIHFGISYCSRDVDVLLVDTGS